MNRTSPPVSVHATPVAVVGTAALVVTTEPPGATVSVDGEDGKPSPLVVKGLHPGKHTVRISKRGWRDVEQTTSLAAGEASTLEVALERPRYLMKIVSEPAGAGC